MRAAWTAAILAVVVASANGQVYRHHQWNVSTGYWTTSGAWNPAGPPDEWSVTHVANGGTCTVPQSINTYLALTVRISNGSKLQHSGGRLCTQGQWLPYYSDVVISADPGQTSTYALGFASTLEVGRDTIVGNLGGGTSRFEHNGGRHETAGALRVGQGTGSTGRYMTIQGSNNYISANELHVGHAGTGYMSHTAGTCTVATEAAIGGGDATGVGEYYLQGAAALSVPKMRVASPPTGGDCGRGSLVLAGGSAAINILEVGRGANAGSSGTIENRAGVVKVKSRLTVGSQALFVGPQGGLCVVTLEAGASGTPAAMDIAAYGQGAPVLAGIEGLELQFAYPSGASGERCVTLEAGCGVTPSSGMFDDPDALIIGKLRIGRASGSGGPVAVTFADATDHGASGADALLVRELEMLPGAKINIGSGPDSDPEHVYFLASDGITPCRLYPGDANLDGAVDLADLAILATNWNLPGNWGEGDFDGNGMVDLADLAIHSTWWNCTTEFDEQLLMDPGSLEAMEYALDATEAVELTDRNGDGTFDILDVRIILQEAGMAAE